MNDTVVRRLKAKTVRGEVYPMARFGDERLNYVGFKLPDGVELPAIFRHSGPGTLKYFKDGSFTVIPAE